MSDKVSCVPWRPTPPTPDSVLMEASCGHWVWASRQTARNQSVSNVICLDCTRY